MSMNLKYMLTLELRVTLYLPEDLDFVMCGVRGYPVV